MRAGPPPLELHAFADTAAWARRLARACATPLRRLAVHVFPDRETLVRVHVPAARRVWLVRHLDDPDPKLFSLLEATDALRRAGARRVGLIAPYLPYMRQDRVFRAGEPVSQQVLGQMLGAAFDDLLTLEPHLHRVSSLSEAFPCRARALAAAPVLASWCRAGRSRTLLVGPDEESRPWVRAVARRAGLPWIVAEKQRLGDRSVRITLPAIPDPTRFTRAVLIDDIASSGTTLAAAARALKRHGLARVDAMVVHALFAPGSQARLRRAGVRRVVSCDTIPHETNGIATAPLFAAALSPGRSR